MLVELGALTSVLIAMYDPFLLSFQIFKISK
jgi:hypothetical protein